MRQPSCLSPRIVCATGHDRQGSITRTSLAAGHWRVQVIDSPFESQFRLTPRCRDGDRAHYDQEAACAHGVEDAAAHENLVANRAGAQHADHGIGPARRGRRAARRRNPKGGKRLGLCFRPIPGCHCVPSLSDAAGHVGPHNARPEKAY